MWEFEHSVDADVEAGKVWGIWTDVARWGEWNGDIERIEISGAFVAGSTIAMTPRGDETVQLTLTDVVAGERFTDEATFGDTVIRTLHRVEARDNGRVRVTYRTEIEGPLGPEIGPQITGDFPETVAALVARARQQ